jgi:hypothetical protein
MVQGQSPPKVSETPLPPHLHQQTCVVADAICGPSQTGDTGSRIMVQGQRGKMQDPT